MPQPELIEPAIALTPMSAGRHVVEDYRAVGLTLRQHPLAFLRSELQPRGILPCCALTTARDGQRVCVAGLVLVRQRPATKTGVTFMTIEDETGIANLIVWSSLFEAQRRIVLSSSMVASHGLVQREGDVIHVVARRLEDLSGLLRGLGSREHEFPLQYGRGDAATHPNGPDPRELRAPKGIRIPTRDFR